jgi:hypothetical protein
MASCRRVSQKNSDAPYRREFFWGYQIAQILNTRLVAAVNFRWRQLGDSD